jgi:hypothetical protein
MKLWLLFTLMDILLFCAYWTLIIKAEVQRVFLHNKSL